MKITFSACLLFLFSFTILSAQSFVLKGTVVDSSTTPLPGATVMLTNAVDSALVSFSLTDNKGQFRLGPAKPGNYRLILTYLGYQSLEKKLDLQEQMENLDLGILVLQEKSTLIEEVKITADHIPIQLKKDTIEFNADAFQTQPNDVVEDLLEQLPGIEVERDGTIRAQGERVNRVTVDGKEFFGTDPKIATKNLPADVVDKVQVFDKKSEQAEFSGIDDGQREKAINLELKEDKKQGYFGNVKAGYGDMARYNGKASLNRFTPNQQFSFIGMANNVNEQGFSINDYINFMGGIQRMMNGGSGSIRLEMNDDNAPLMLALNPNNGLTTSLGGGLNFNQEFNPKTDLRSNYFFNRLENQNDQTTRRTSFLGDQTFVSESQLSQNTENDNHRLNVSLEKELNKMQSFELSSRLGYNNTRFQSTSSSYTFSNDQQENGSQRNYRAEGENYNAEVDLIYRNKFKKKGRTFSTAFNLGLSDDISEGNLHSSNEFFKSGNLDRTDTLRQENRQENDQLSFGARTSFTEPLGKGKYVELNYSYQQNTDDIDRKVYDLLGELPDEKQFNEQLSQQYASAYIYNRGGITFRYNKGNFNFSSGLNLQYTSLDGELTLQDIQIKKSFCNILPNLRADYEIGLANRLSFDYETEVSAPSIQDLQPVVDNSDPLNIYIGNPDLRPEYAHRFQARYMLFNQATLTNFFVNASYTFTENAIGQAESIDEQFVRALMPVNVAGEHRVSSMIAFSAPLRFIQSRINNHTNFSYTKGINFVNDLENITSRWYASSDVRLENRFKEKMDVSVGAKLSYNFTEYSLESSTSQNFIDQTYYADFTLNLPLGFTFSTSLDYDIYAGRAEGFNDAIALWDVAVSKFVFQDKRGELRFGVADLLNQNTGITRRAELNYVQDQRTRNLGRYFILSFTYALKGFKS